MLHSKMTNLLTAGAAALALGFSASSFAQGAGQTQQQAPQQQQQQAPSIDVSDDQAAAFAEAQGRVAEIGQKWTPRMQAAESSEDIQKARESAQKEMVIAVENTGLSVQEYNQIAQAAQADPELRERIESQ